MQQALQSSKDPDSLLGGTTESARMRKRQSLSFVWYHLSRRTWGDITIRISKKLLNSKPFHCPSYSGLILTDKLLQNGRFAYLVLQEAWNFSLTPWNSKHIHSSQVVQVLTRGIVMALRTYLKIMHCRRAEMKPEAWAGSWQDSLQALGGCGKPDTWMGKDFSESHPDFSPQ